MQTYRCVCAAGVLRTLFQANCLAHISEMFPRKAIKPQLYACYGMVHARQTYFGAEGDVSKKAHFLKQQIDFDNL
jgi:hypothetical protein